MADPRAAGVTIVFLHHLGGSRHTWDAVARRFGTALALDLPGFGEAAGMAGTDVAAMADHVVNQVPNAGPWMLAGLSMGVKVALAVARRAEDGAARLDGLAGLVLAAGSPPGPEPMDDSRRTTMLTWFRGDTAQSRAEAETFVAANVAHPLPSAVHDAAVADLLRMNPAAWAAWLQQGSREDWAGRVGRLQIPALILAGREDGDLGPDAQRRLMAPHFRHAELAVVDDAKHLLPMEQPDAVAALITAFAAGLQPFLRPQ